MALFLPNLKQNGFLDPVHITICNVGSRKISFDDDYGSQAWEIFAPNLTIYGFDADADACEAANQDIVDRQINWQEKHLPFIISDSIGEATLYVTANPMCSSLYPPNEPYLKRFSGLLDLVGLEFSVDLETTTLDALVSEGEIHDIDFLQIDVQGADIQVLKGAQSLLQRSVLAVQIEVEFSQLYANQPLFAEVDQFLRSQGFMLFDLLPSRLQRSPLGAAVHPGQLLWGEAFYVRDPLQHPDVFYAKPEQILKLACIADALQFSDYALELLEHLVINHHTVPKYNFADCIVHSIANIPNIVEAKLETFPPIANLKPFLTQSLAEIENTAIAKNQAEFASPAETFQAASYLRHNQRRQEHLATLGLNLANRSVLEVGAGIGDHTSFFIDRDCPVVITDGRVENVEMLRSRYPEFPVQLLDLNHPDPTFQGQFDIVYCYGLLYHLHKPAEAIAFMAEHCQELLLLETCVSYGEEDQINICFEYATSPSQSISGQGCRPTRRWIFNQLKQHFDYVYLPLTQPNHPQFPLDWSIPTNAETGETYTRAVFIASRKPIQNALLVEDVPMQQHRH
jgi:FkbM family methyltransferase